jgi:putative ABC transport system ATP-binding protein
MVSLSIGHHVKSDALLKRTENFQKKEKNMALAVQAQHVSMLYTSSTGQKVQALEDVSLEIPSGSWCVLSGPSGSGKSSMLHILGGLLTPTTGVIEVAGHNLTMATPTLRSTYRLYTVGFVFQSFYLLPHLCAWENVALPLLAAGEASKVRKERATLALKEVGLADRLYHHPTELSGGEQQRVALARAIVNHPSIILADEPTGNLDAASAKMILDILEKLVQQGATIVCATHDTKVIERATLLVSMQYGKVVSHV